MSHLNEEPAWKLTQKVALTHNLVKNNDCDVTYVLKESQRRSKCIITRHDVSHCSVNVAVITELCISAAYRISSSGSSLIRTNITADVLPWFLMGHGFLIEQFRLVHWSLSGYYLSQMAHQCWSSQFVWHKVTRNPHVPWMGGILVHHRLSSHLRLVPIYTNMWRGASRLSAVLLKDIWKWEWDSNPQLSASLALDHVDHYYHSTDPLLITVGVKYPWAVMIWEIC
jgi:hypothetical protein